MTRYLILLLGIGLPFMGFSQCDPVAIFANDSTNAVCFEEVNHVRKCYTNNIPDHTYGPFAGPNVLEAQEFDYSMCRYPQLAMTSTPLEEELNPQGCQGGIIFGISMQGVNYSPYARLYWTNPSGQENTDFHIEADFALMMDLNGGHVNAVSRYHYHNIPQDYFDNDLNIDGNSHSPILGYAADGFPIYYKYLYTDSLDANGGISAFSSSHSLKMGNRPGDGITAPNGAYDGNFVQDYEYISSLSDLDECGGRFAITPEYPNGTYYYVLTDNWPYIPRCLKGTQVDNSFRVGPNCPASTADQDCSTVATAIESLLDLQINMNVYPNPARDYLNLVVEGEGALTHKITSVRIYGLNAETVYASPVFEETINIDHISKGTYFIQIDFGKQQLTKMIQIQ